jgi:hypothetical protein
MIIRQREEDRSPSRHAEFRPAERSRMPQRPYRTNDDMRIVDKTFEERSRSADGRLEALRRD